MRTPRLTSLTNLVPPFTEWRYPVAVQIKLTKGDGKVTVTMLVADGQPSGYQLTADAGDKIEVTTGAAEPIASADAKP